MSNSTAPHHPPKGLEVFDEIYAAGGWDNEGSGPGSSPKEAAPYIEFIDNLLVSALDLTRKNNLVADWGCGDGRVICELAKRRREIQFMAYDCCESEIRKNMGKSSGVYFGVKDISRPMDIPEENARFILIKDVLHHWPNEMVMRFLREFSQLRTVNWLIITTDVNGSSEHGNCEIGGYRPINFVQKGAWWKAKREYGILKIHTYNHKAIWSMPSGGARDAIKINSAIHESMFGNSVKISTAPASVGAGG